MLLSENTTKEAKRVLNSYASATAISHHRHTLTSEECQIETKLQEASFRV